MTMNQRIVLARRPEGEPVADDFRQEEAEIPELKDGEILTRTLRLSLDPYMRGRLSAAKSYAASVEIGDPITAQTVAEVAASRNARFKPGDIVVTSGGWQTYAVEDGALTRKVDPTLGPLSWHLGVLGMPGITAWCGLMIHGEPKSGETVVVGAATGAVGSVVGQIARIKGCRAIGVAGGAEKCAWAVEGLKFDACVDHRADDFEARLKTACPDGVDVYFENVSGRVFWGVLPLLNDFARMPVCGLIANYNMTALPEGPDRTPALMRAILTHRLKLRGFIVFDHYDRSREALQDLSGWLKSGEIVYREDVVDGFEHTVDAFRGLLKGENFGKLVIKVAEPSGG